MKPAVDKNLCIGCQTCVSICPEVFKMEDDGKAGVVTELNFDEYKDKIEDAKNSCPVAAISIQ